MPCCCNPTGGFREQDPKQRIKANLLSSYLQRFQGDIYLQRGKGPHSPQYRGSGATGEEKIGLCSRQDRVPTVRIGTHPYPMTSAKALIQRHHEALSEVRELDLITSSVLRATTQVKGLTQPA